MPSAEANIEAMIHDRWLVQKLVVQDVEELCKLYGEDENVVKLAKAYQQAVVDRTNLDIAFLQKVRDRKVV